MFRTVHHQIEMFIEQVHLADIAGMYTGMFSRNFEIWVDSMH